MKEMRGILLFSQIYNDKVTRVRGHEDISL